jgi:hypothetical protein
MIAVMLELKQDPVVWQQGYHAGLLLTDQRCPYEVGSALAWAWRSGFLEGREERNRQSGT